MEMQGQYQKHIFTKGLNIVDEDQHIVEGIITDDLIDIDGHVIDKQGFKDALPDYLSWGNIRDQHGTPVAKVVGTPDWNVLQVEVVDDSVWKKIKAGIYKGFSIGIRVYDFVAEDINKYTDESYIGLPPLIVNAIKQSGAILRITKMVLAEVSIVDRPANPRALITSIKSAESKSDLPVVPVNEFVKKAQGLQGDIKMGKENEQVETQLEDTTENQDLEQKGATESEDQGVADYEARIASLEKTVSDLSDVVTNASNDFATVRDEIKSIQDTMKDTLALLQEKAAAETVEVEAEAEAAVEDEEAAEDTTDDFAKQFKELFEKAMTDMKAAVKETVDEAVKNLQPTEVESERVGGVNGGDPDEEALEEAKKEVANRKPTYKEAALAIAKMIEDKKFS